MIMATTSTTPSPPTPMALKLKKIQIFRSDNNQHSDYRKKILSRTTTPPPNFKKKMKDLKRNHDQSSKFSDLQQIGSVKTNVRRRKRMGKRKIPKHNKIDPSVTDDHTKHLNSTTTQAPKFLLAVAWCAGAGSSAVAVRASTVFHHCRFCCRNEAKKLENRERERDGDDDDKSSSKTRKLAILTNSRTRWFSATASLLVIYKMGLMSQKEIPFFFFGDLWGPLKIYIY